VFGKGIIKHVKYLYICKKHVNKNCDMLLWTNMENMLVC